MIVTGAGFGIGRGIAEYFAKNGASVAIFDLDEQTAKETEEIITKAGGKSKSYKTDVASYDSVIQNVAQVKKDSGSRRYSSKQCWHQIRQKSSRYS